MFTILEYRWIRETEQGFLEVYRDKGYDKLERNMDRREKLVYIKRNQLYINRNPLTLLGVGEEVGRREILS